MKLRGRIDGLSALNAYLSAIAEEGALAPDLQAAAEDVRDRAAANLEGTGSSGTLAGSLAVTPDESGGYVVGTPLDYGWYREFGTRTQPAAPWLAPAAEAARPGFVTRLAARLDAMLRRAAPRG